MAFDEEFANRIRVVLKRRRGITEKKMFGGLAFLVHGNMVCGVLGTDLMARLGEDGVERALVQRGTRLMDFTGRPSKTMVYVSAGVCATEAALRDWVEQSLRYAQSLPRKP